jgi:hypothetical protein
LDELRERRSVPHGNAPAFAVSLEKAWNRFFKRSRCEGRESALSAVSQPTAARPIGASPERNSIRLPAGVVGAVRYDG